MNYRIIFSSGANADIRSTVLWYERIDPNLAFRFILETSKALRRIARGREAYEEGRHRLTQAHGRRGAGVTAIRV